MLELDPPEESPESKGSANASSLLIPLIPLLLLSSLVVRNGIVCILGDGIVAVFSFGDAFVFVVAFAFVFAFAFEFVIEVAFAFAFVEPITIGFSVITSEGNVGLSLLNGTDGADGLAPGTDAELADAIDDLNRCGSVTDKFRSRTMRATASNSAASVRPFLISAPVKGRRDNAETKGKGKGGTLA